MRSSLRRFHVAVCVVELAACGSVRSPVPIDGESGDATSVLPGSCVGLPMTCGASGDDNCCNSPVVIGGTYDRSYDLAGDVNSGDMSFPATIGSFHLDKYEVTVGRFRAFVTAAMGTQSNPPLTRTGADASIAGSG
jgi:sulfatase modifying factor 1